MTGREILLAAMQEYENTYIDEMPSSEEDIPLDEEAIPELLYHVKHANNPFFRFFDTVNKRAVGVAAVLVVLIGCFAMVPPIDGRYQKPLSHRLRVIVFGEYEPPQTIETRYTLGYIPEGYARTQNIAFTSNPDMKDKAVQLIWTDSEEDEIILTQSTLDRKSWEPDYGTMVSEISFPCYQLPIISRDVLVDVLTIHPYPLKNEMLYYWSEKDYFYSLRVPMAMPWEECEAMIRSLVELEP